MNVLLLRLRPACRTLYTGLFLLCLPSLVLAAPVNQSMLDYDDYTDAAKTAPQRTALPPSPKTQENPMQAGQTVLVAPLRVLVTPAPNAMPGTTEGVPGQLVIPPSMMPQADIFGQQFTKFLLEALQERGLRAEMAIPAIAANTSEMPLPPLRDLRDEQNNAVRLPKEGKQTAANHKASPEPAPQPGTGTLGGELEIVPPVFTLQEPKAGKKGNRRLLAQAAATLRYSILLEVPGSKAVLLRGEKQGTAALHMPFTPEQETQAALGATTQKFALQRLAENMVDALMGQLPVPEQAVKAKPRGKKRSR